MMWQQKCLGMKGVIYYYTYFIPYDLCAQMTIGGCASNIEWFYHQIWLGENQKYPKSKIDLAVKSKTVARSILIIQQKCEDMKCEKHNYKMIVAYK